VFVRWFHLVFSPNITLILIFLAKMNIYSTYLSKLRLPREYSVVTLIANKSVGYYEIP
jgi:hypothetical protein